MVINILLDVGNSAIKWTTESNGILSTVNSFKYTSSTLVDQLFSEILLKKDSQISAIYISNVAGVEVKKKLQDWFFNQFEQVPTFAFVSETAYGLKNAYINPDQLGVDRWLALLGAKQRFGVPLCVIDCGTAVTIDAVDENAVFIGGVILPGLHMMQQLLITNTDAINNLENEAVTNMFCKNTSRGVFTGTTLAIASLAERMVTNLEVLTGSNVTCLLTGGSCGEIQHNLQIKTRYLPDLVLEGLYLWGKENAMD